MNDVVCHLEDVHKAFGGVQALNGVDLAIRSGEVHAILGENGAGKSTLVKIIAGAEQSDRGRMLLHGVECGFATSAEAADAGVSIVFQEFSLFPDLDVLSNLYVGGMPTQFGLISRRTMKRDAERVLTEIGLEIDLDRAVDTCSLAERQLIEIAKALLQESDILILDEPNSALNAGETERLMRVVRHLRNAGVAVLYISHRLEEVFEIADTVTVMRNGRVAETAPASDWSMEGAVRAMLGHQAGHLEELGRDQPERLEDGEPIVSFEDVSVGNTLKGVSFGVSSGEVVGLAGLEGSGAREVLGVIFGLENMDRGSGHLGSSAIPMSTYGAVRGGVAYVPPDRKSDGVMLEQSVSMNVNHVSAGTLGRVGFGLSRQRLDARTRDAIRRLRIATNGPETPVNKLSGGNQQKVVLAKWLETEPELFLLDDPTRGVDVGAKSQIYSLISDLANAGKAVLFTSTEMGEYSRVCDRILVFRSGQIVGEMSGSQASEHALLEAVNSW